MKKRSPRNCYHRKTKIIKLYRKNYSHGTKSKPKKYDPPKLCIEICNNCGMKLEKWNTKQKKN